MQCQFKKEAFEAGEKNTFYIGNLRFQTPKVEDATSEDIAKAASGDEDDFQF